MHFQRNDENGGGHITYPFSLARGRAAHQLSFMAYCPVCLPLSPKNRIEGYPKGKVVLEKHCAAYWPKSLWPVVHNLQAADWYRSISYFCVFSHLVRAKTNVLVKKKWSSEETKETHNF